MSIERNKTIWRRLAWAALGACAWILVGLFIGIRVTKQPPMDLNYSPNWIVIMDQDVVLDPGEGPVHARVGVISRLSGEATEQTVLQNKIEVTQGGKTVSFMWPDPTIYAAAGKCQIADLDGDGRKEFLLLDWAEGFNEARVVSYAQGQFQFRKKTDELVSLENNLEPTDLNRDGRLEFLSEKRLPENTDSRSIRIPVVMHWSTKIRQVYSDAIDCTRRGCVEPLVL